MTTTTEKTYTLVIPRPLYDQLASAEVLKDDTCFRRYNPCLLYTSPSPRDRTRSRMPSSA